MAEKTHAEMDAELKQLQLETARIELESKRAQVEEFNAQKAQRQRGKEQRETQLRQDRRDARQAILECSHQQGGHVGGGRERQGNGPTALRGVVMPQDERRLVMCANCPLRVWEPRRADGFEAARPGESKEQAQKRALRYREQMAEFELLWEKARSKALTPEAGTPMHAGKTFHFEDGNGNNAHVPHPCDGYSQGLDNRRVA